MLLRTCFRSVKFVWCILYLKNEEKVEQNCLIIIQLKLTLAVYAMSAMET